MHHPLAPDEMYPAGVAGVTARTVALPTGVRLRVVEAGPAGGTPVVMLHGWGASAFMFRHALVRFPAMGLRVIAPDLRGFGLSDKPPDVDSYSLTAYAGDLDALLDALSLPRSALVGQSMGGGLALHYALSRPSRVTSLALINPACLGVIPALRVVRVVPTAIAEAIGAHVSRGMIAALLRHVAYGDPALVTENTIDEYWAPTRLPGFAHAAHAALVAFDWRRLTDAAAESLAVPTLVILGDRDRLIHTTRADALRLGGADVKSVPGGHCANEEHPEVVYSMIERFMERAGG